MSLQHIQTSRALHNVKYRMTTRDVRRSMTEAVLVPAQRRRSRCADMRQVPWFRTVGIYMDIVHVSYLLRTRTYARTRDQTANTIGHRVDE